MQQLAHPPRPNRQHHLQPQGQSDCTCVIRGRAFCLLNKGQICACFPACMCMLSARAAMFRPCCVHAAALPVSCERCTASGCERARRLRSCVSSPIAVIVPCEKDTFAMLTLSTPTMAPGAAEVAQARKGCPLPAAVYDCVCVPYGVAGTWRQDPALLDAACPHHHRRRPASGSGPAWPATSAPAWQVVLEPD